MEAKVCKWSGNFYGRAVSKYKCRKNILLQRQRHGHDGPSEREDPFDCTEFCLGSSKTTTRYFMEESCQIFVSLHACKLVAVIAALDVDTSDHPEVNCKLTGLE